MTPNAESPRNGTLRREDTFPCANPPPQKSTRVALSGGMFSARHFLLSTWISIRVRGRCCAPVAPPYDQPPNGQQEQDNKRNRHADSETT